MNSDRIFFSSKNIYHDLPELSPMQVRRLNQPSLQYPGCQRYFFSLGATELSGEAAKASREATRNTTRRQTLLALTLLTVGEREDLWHPGYRSKVTPKSNRIEFGSAHEWSGVWNGP